MEAGGSAVLAIPAIPLGACSGVPHSELPLTTAGAQNPLCRTRSIVSTVPRTPAPGTHVLHPAHIHRGHRCRSIPATKDGGVRDTLQGSHPIVGGGAPRSSLCPQSRTTPQPRPAAGGEKRGTRRGDGAAPVPLPPPVLSSLPPPPPTPPQSSPSQAGTTPDGSGAAPAAYLAAEPGAPSRRAAAGAGSAAPLFCPLPR